MKRIVILLIILSFSLLGEKTIDYKFSFYEKNPELTVEKLNLTVVHSEYEAVNGWDFVFLTSKVNGNQTGTKIGGLVSEVKGDMTGVSLFHVMNEVQGEFKGVQIGVVNLDKKTRAFRLGIINLAEDMSGVDMAAVNFNKKVNGIQVGIFNYAEELNGVQLGIANFAKNSVLPVTLLFNYASTEQ